MKTNTLTKKIMRRVYYAFAIRLTTHPVTVNIAAFVFGLFVFAKMVHVARVVQSFETLPLAQLPTYITNALSRGEILTLASMALMAFAFARTAQYFGTVRMHQPNFALQ